MKQNNFKQNLQPALKFAGVLGTVGGFVADVLSPLGPILNYLLYLSITALIISLVLFVLLPKSKKEVFKMASLSSLFFAIIFGIFVNLNKGSENGFLGDNIEFVSEFQASLNIIEIKLDEISDQIEVVDEKLDIVDDKIDDIASLIKNSDPINNPSSAKDHIINAYLFTGRGNLVKAQSSFEAYFNLTEQYKIDVLLDYAKVLESNEGYSSVKYFFENLKQNNDNGINAAEIIYMSNSNVSLAKDLMKLQKEDIIFRWALLTLKVVTFFEISGSYQFDEPEYESSKTLYYNTLNKSVENHLEIGCDFKVVHQYFLNTQKAKELVFSNKLNNVPGYYNWFVNTDDRLDFNTFNKLKEMGCHRN
tara:strand:- start:3488 stop:4573 length:1086 start_codon:yes stop_codon:yes gene_type:complete